MSFRKRPKQSPVRSPRSDSVKRKKVSTPETSTQNAAEKSSDVAEKKEPPAKDDDKDNKKSKKEKGKRETVLTESLKIVERNSTG